MTCHRRREQAEIASRVTTGFFPEACQEVLDNQVVVFIVFAVFRMVWLMIKLERSLGRLHNANL
jgi:hypothetical protein